MNIETERKFLVLGDGYKADAVDVHRIRQGYIAHEGGRSVRIRIRDDKGILGIKGPVMEDGMSRLEWEKVLTLEEAADLFRLCKPGVIDKSRYIVPAGNGRCFEVDEFYGDNEGLVMAEIELGSADETFVCPSWLGEEVTGDKRYFNAYLARMPFKYW